MKEGVRSVGIVQPRVDVGEFDLKSGDAIIGFLSSSPSKITTLHIAKFKALMPGDFREPVFDGTNLRIHLPYGSTASAVLEELPVLFKNYRNKGVPYVLVYYGGEIQARSTPDGKPDFRMANETAFANLDERHKERKLNGIRIYSEFVPR